jgi:hypothetical protein
MKPFRLRNRAFKQSELLDTPADPQDGKSDIPILPHANRKTGRDDGEIRAALKTGTGFRLNRDVQTET